MTPTTVEELQDALQAIGRNPDGVQRDHDPARVPQDGVWILRADAQRVTIAMISRDSLIGIEHYDTEGEAVAVLHRRLVLNRPMGEPESPEMRAAAIERMQAKAAADAERRRASRGE
jgi:hypothetical protein